LHGASGWSLITPHRTYHLFADTEVESVAWRSALSQMAMLMVPPEVRKTRKANETNKQALRGIEIKEGVKGYY